MTVLGDSLKILLFLFLKLVYIIPRSNGDVDCVYGHEGIGVHSGRFSPAEKDLQDAYLSSLYHREPTMEERKEYYNELRNGELTKEELQVMLNSQKQSSEHLCLQSALRLSAVCAYNAIAMALRPPSA